MFTRLPILNYKSIDIKHRDDNSNERHPVNEI